MTLRQALKRPDEHGNYGDIPVGTIIVMKSGLRILVGDINQSGGMCDDCKIECMNEEVVEVIIPPDPAGPIGEVTGL